MRSMDPTFITENQKRNRMKLASDFLDLYGYCDQRRLNEKVTGAKRGFTIF